MEKKRGPPLPPQQAQAQLAMDMDPDPQPPIPVEVPRNAFRPKRILARNKDVDTQPAAIPRPKAIEQPQRQKKRLKSRRLKTRRRHRDEDRKRADVIEDDADTNMASNG